MKRMTIWIRLGGLIVSLLLVVAAFHGRWSGIVPEVYAQNDNSQGGCTNASLNGTYGFYRTGTTSQGPLAALGTITYDGNGVASGHQTISRNGVFQNVASQGFYQVNLDCTGTLLSNDDITVIGLFVIVDQGKEVLILSTTPGNAVYGVERKL